jgi:5-methylthioadenosine/S-adenosylhomocysteine deaminase
MYFHSEQVALAAEESGMRATIGYGMADRGSRKKAKSELLQAKRFIERWHGKAGGRIRCSVAPHSIYTCSPWLLAQAEGLSKKYGIPLHIHLSETRKEVFECLGKNKRRPAYFLDSLGIVSSRLVAAHCVWLTKEEVRLLAKKKASAALCPVSNMKLAGGGAAPMPEMQEFGMNISLGTDGSASNNSLSMFETMKTLGLLQKNSRWDATAAKDAAIFEAATAGGARALGIEAGEIKEGKLADFSLIRLKAANMVPAHSLVSNLVYCAHPGNVSDVVIDGKIVMESQAILTLDEEKVIEEAQKEAERLSS